MLTISVVGYGAFYTYEKFERMQEANDELRHEVDTIKKVIFSPKTLPQSLALSMKFLFYFWSWLYWGEATSLMIDPLLEEINRILAEISETQVGLVHRKAMKRSRR